MKTVLINVTSDFICPWCWIGHQHLKAALKQTPEIEVQMRYLPYELNPLMPKEGVSRRAYRSQKFGGWERSQVMDADVAAAGQRAGVNFDYSKVELTPNTRLAHRLMYFIQQQGQPHKASVFFDAVFSAYFSEGRDIGAMDVLADIAAIAGFDRNAVVDYLKSEDGNTEVAELEQQAQDSYVRSVPTVRINDTELTGAQPIYVFASALKEASEELLGHIKHV